MKKPGSILLISCYELGHQPMGLALSMGVLRQAGYAPDAIDLALDGLDTDQVARARFVGISVPMHTALRIGARAAVRVRAINPACHIGFLGLYAGLNGDFLLDHLADSVIGGEYEAPLLALVDELSAGTDRPIPGVARRGRPATPFLKRVATGVPDRTALPTLSRYAHLEENGVLRTVGYTEASHGCRHHCKHCPIPPVYGGRFLIVPTETVFSDIQNLVEAGATHITLGDPDFLNAPNHAMRVAQGLHQRFPHVTFDFTAKIEHLIRHRGLIPLFGRLGCLFIISAVESFSDAVLSRLDKGHTRADIFEAFAIARDAHIPLRPSLVPFTPWTTLADYIELFDLIESEGMIDQVDPVQYTIRLLIPPGSLLLKEMGPSPGPNLGPLMAESFMYPWTHPDPRMDVLQREVSGWVENRAGDDPADIFFQLREMARALRDGRPVAPLPPSVHPAHRPRPPRLTESWFCCAEPTERQIEVTSA